MFKSTKLSRRTKNLIGWRNIKTNQSIYRLSLKQANPGILSTKTSGVAIRHHSIIDPGKPSVGGLFENTVTDAS
jgi:hypothetical protein